MPFRNFGQTPMLSGNDGIGGVLSDPTNQALLALSAGLISGGGPSPVPRSFGQNIAQAGMGAMNAFTGAQNANQQRAMQQAQLGLLQQNLRKSQMEAALAERFANGGTDLKDPAQLEDAARFALATGLPGAATLSTLAQNQREAQQGRQAVSGMQSRPGFLGAGVSTDSPQGRALLSNLTGDQSWDAAVIAAQNEALNSNTKIPAQPVQAPKIGLFGPLLASPHVGVYAQQYQQQLDDPSALNQKPDYWTGLAGRLTQQHLTATNQNAAREDNQAHRQLMLDQQLANQRLIAGMGRRSADDRREDLESQRLFSRENTLRDDYSRDTKDFKEFLSIFEPQAEYLSGQKFTSSGDRALLFSYARMLDPRDRVGVRDVADIDKLGSIPERWKQAIVNLFEGKELPDRVRQEMYDVMERNYLIADERQAEIEDLYTSRSRASMVKPENVVTRYSTKKRKAGGWSATRD